MARRLGDILLERGLIDDKQLRAALAEAALWGHRLGEVLIARGECSEAQVLDALSTQLGVGVAPLSTTVAVDPKVLDLLPADFAREHKALPLHLDGRTGLLEVALVDPTDAGLVQAIEARTHRRIRPLVALAADLDEAIRRFYFAGADPDGQGPFRRLATPVRSAGPRPRPLSVHSVPSGAMTPPRGLPAASLGGHAPSRTHSTLSTRRDESPIGSSEGRTPESDALIALRAEVDLLRRQLARAYELLRETTAAHQVLLTTLRDAGTLDVKGYQTALQARLEKIRGPR